jgi:hypothetical protein
VDGRTSKEEPPILFKLVEFKRQDVKCPMKWKYGRPTRHVNGKSSKFATGSKGWNLTKMDSFRAMHSQIGLQDTVLWIIQIIFNLYIWKAQAELKLILLSLAAPHNLNLIRRRPGHGISGSKPKTFTLHRSAGKCVSSHARLQYGWWPSYDPQEPRLITICHLIIISIFSEVRSWVLWIHVQSLTRIGTQVPSRTQKA